MEKNKRDTYEIVMKAIRSQHNKTKIREIVYGDSEGVAMSNFINSRMYADDIIRELEALIK